MKGKLADKYLVIILLSALAFATIMAVSNNLIQSSLSEALGYTMN